MLDIDSLVMLIGSINAQCTVRPSGNKVAAMPVKAHAMTPIFFDFSKSKR